MRTGWRRSSPEALDAAALLDLRFPGHRANVTIVTPRRIRRPGIDARRVVLPPEDIIVVNNISCTSGGRTLLDCAAERRIQQRDLERMLEEAEKVRVPLGDLHERAANAPGHRGVGKLRRALDDLQIGTTVTKSELEEALLRFCDSRGFRRPVCNRWIADVELEVDAIWDDVDLVIELQGYRHHGTKAAFERDPVRIERLSVIGKRVVPVTWRRLHREGDELAASLAVLLATSARRPSAPGTGSSSLAARSAGLP
jgi:very-short-patch-repair endonuclease